MRDGLRSIRSLLDASGAAVSTYDYYAFGDELAVIEGVVSPFRFAARERELGGPAARLGLGLLDNDRETV